MMRTQRYRLSYHEINSDGNAPALLNTMKDCTKELSRISAQQLALTRRQKRVTERLQQLARGDETETDISTDSETLPNLLSYNSENKEMQKTKSFVKPTPGPVDPFISKGEMSVSSVPEPMKGFDEFVQEEDLNGEQSSPLIVALKKLQQRRGQKRGIKMWTQNLANLFFIADSDRSGVIECREYSQMINKLDLSESLKSSLLEKFKNIDEDGSGGINLYEFLLFFLKFPKFKEELLLNAHNNAPYIYESTLTTRQRLRQWLYCIVECPGYNIVSKVLFTFDLFVTLIPIVILCIEGIWTSYRVEWYKDTYMWCVSILFAFEFLCGLSMCKYPKVFLLDPGHVLDAVSFVFWIVYNTFGNEENIDPMGFIVFRAFRLGKIHYIFKFETLKEDLDIYINTLTLAYTSYGAVAWLLLCSIFFFSLLVYVFERGEYDEEYKIWRRDDQLESPFSNLYNCMYFTVVTMTTLGYGDISPRSKVGKLVAIVTVIVGLCNITFLINIVGDCFEEVFREFVLKRSKKMEEEHSKFIKHCVSKASQSLSLMQSASLLGCVGYKQSRKVKLPIEELSNMGNHKNDDQER